MAAAVHPYAPYRPQDAIKIGLSSTLSSSFVGLSVSAMQNAMSSHRMGALGVLTRTGGTIAIFGKYMNFILHYLDLV